MNFRVTFKALAAIFRFPMKVVFWLKPKGTLKPALLLPRTDKALDQLHWWMRCVFSSAPSYPCAVFFSVRPSIFIPSLHLLPLRLILFLLPFAHNHLSHFICGTRLLLLCCLILQHTFYDIPSFKLHLVYSS